MSGDCGVARAALALMRLWTWRTIQDMIMLERWDALDDFIRLTNGNFRLENREITALTADNRTPQA